MRALLIVLAASALLAAGCGGSSTKSAEPAPPQTTEPAPPQTTETTPPATTEPAPPLEFVKGPVFSRTDLERLALRPVDAPTGLRYVRQESGPRTLEAIGLYLPRQINAVRRHGFVKVYDAIFASTTTGIDRRVGERLWLFKTAKGASNFLAQTRDDSLAVRIDPIDTPTFGNESWAGRGLLQIGGGEIVTHAFRLGNAVFTVTLYGLETPVSEIDARTVTRKALTRARSA